MSLDALAANQVQNVSLETVIETIWAITHFVYTNDNEVNFVRHYTQGPKAGGKQAAQTTIRSFLVDQASTPAEIAKLACEVVKDEPRQLELDPSAPRFTQLVRKVELLVAQDDDRGPGYQHVGKDRASY